MAIVLLASTKYRLQRELDIAGNREMLINPDFTSLARLTKLLWELLIQDRQPIAKSFTRSFLRSLLHLRGRSAQYPPPFRYLTRGSCDRLALEPAIHFLMSEPNIGNPSVVMARRPHLVLSLPPDPANAQVFRSPHSLSSSPTDRRGCRIALAALCGQSVGDPSFIFQPPPLLPVLWYSSIRPVLKPSLFPTSVQLLFSRLPATLPE